MPGFRYHPDPVATGSAEVSGAACDLCGKRSGFRYEGPISGVEVAEICLGCIADGTASERLAAYLFKCLHCGAHLAHSDAS
jgi:uncharacterized protein CbrC (UPF0167 family)